MPVHFVVRFVVAESQNLVLNVLDCLDPWDLFCLNLFSLEHLVSFDIKRCALCIVYILKDIYFLLTLKCLWKIPTRFLASSYAHKLVQLHYLNLSPWDQYRHQFMTLDFCHIVILCRHSVKSSCFCHLYIKTV
jgi:hypothetical protein